MKIDSPAFIDSFGIPPISSSADQLISLTRTNPYVDRDQADLDDRTAQLLNYLRASRLHVGLFLNFGETAQFKRVVWIRSLPP
ncbi:MAG TPA: GxxExxY protein [Gemmatimonadales bacterium]|nr:GxxExxY protein [Gemmatimonadales bacterium]